MQPYTLNSGIYPFNGNILNLGSFAGSYSLLTGGRTYTGSFNYTLAAFSGLAAYTFTQFTETSPTSISLSGLGDVNFGYLEAFAMALPQRLRGRHRGQWISFGTRSPEPERVLASMENTSTGAQVR